MAASNSGIRRHRILVKQAGRKTAVVWGAQDNLGILFEPNFQFLIPGLSLEPTEQGEFY